MKTKLAIYVLVNECKLSLKKDPILRLQEAGQFSMLREVLTCDIKNRLKAQQTGLKNVRKVYFNVRQLIANQNYLQQHICL